MGIRLHTTRLLLCLGLLAVFASPTWGQVDVGTYPNKPVRVVVPFAPGGSTDLLARLLGERLSASLGQNFVVDNRGGGGGTAGCEMVARAVPDGYTLMVTNQGPMIQNVLLRKQPAYVVSDFAPVVYIGSSPLIIVANPKFPPNNVSELLAYAKANPGKVNWGSSGTNSNPHTALELLKAVTGVNIKHIPYKGTGPALIEVVGGQIDAMYTTTLSAEAYIKPGRVKVLATASPKRQALLPDVPTLAEQGVQGANNSVWIGLVAPAKTPRPLIDKLNREVNRVMQLPDIRQRLTQLGLESEGGTPEDFVPVIQEEVEGLTRLIKIGAVQVE